MHEKQSIAIKQAIKMKKKSVQMAGISLDNFLKS